MELYHEIKENSYLIILSGTLDGNNAGEIELTLKKAVKSDKEIILIDCRQLNYISSAGIGIFLSILPAITERGKKLQFIEVNSNVYKVFEVLGLTHLVSFSNSVQEK